MFFVKCCPLVPKLKMTELAVLSAVQQLASATVAESEPMQQESQDVEEGGGNKNRPRTRLQFFTHRKPCRMLVFSAFVILLVLLVYVMHLLLKHISDLTNNTVFWDNVKDVYSAYVIAQQQKNNTLSEG